MLFSRRTKTLSGHPCIKRLFIRPRSVKLASALRYYDMERPVVLLVDASDYGIRAALLQPNKTEELQPVAYASCSLSKTEQRYSQSEKECLAMCIAFRKHDILVHSDHQPLETIFKRPLVKAPPACSEWWGSNITRFRLHTNPARFCGLRTLYSVPITTMPMM